MHFYFEKIILPPLQPLIPVLKTLPPVLWTSSATVPLPVPSNDVALTEMQM